MQQVSWHPAMNRFRDPTGIAHVIGEPDANNQAGALCGARPFALGGGFAAAKDGGAHECVLCQKIVDRRAGGNA